MKKVIVLYSGGLDSAVCLAKAIADPGIAEVLALTFKYDQSSKDEIQVASLLTERWGIPHLIQEVNQIDLKKDVNKEIPGRNTIFLSIALKLALEQGFNEIQIGAEPGSSYPDSSEEFVEKANTLTASFGISVTAPVKHNKNKAETLWQALDLGIPMHLIHSCRNSPKCWSCKTCQWFEEALISLFPNINVRQLHQHWVDALWKCSLSSNSLEIGYSPVSSFKWLPALLSLSSGAASSGKVVTTGNWGAALLVAKQLVKWSPIFTIQQVKGQDVSAFSESVLNTDNYAAQWGMKQLLWLLPRPRYCDRSLIVPVTQGHLKKACESLGYKVNDGSAGVVVVTKSY